MALKQKEQSTWSVRTSLWRSRWREKMHGYTPFGLSWSSSTYSDDGVSGMIYPHKTGCNSPVPLQRNCDIKNLSSRANTLSCTHKCWGQMHVSIPWNMFQHGQQATAEAARKTHLQCSHSLWEAIEQSWGYHQSFIKLYNNGNWTQLNYITQ